MLAEVGGARQLMNPDGYVPDGDERRRIPFVWFPPFDADSTHEAKDMTTGDQRGADPADWSPTPGAKDLLK